MRSMGEKAMAQMPSQPQLSYPRLMVETYLDLVDSRRRYVQRVKSYERLGTAWPGPTSIIDVFDNLIKMVRAEVEAWVKSQPVYDAWMRDIKGLGPINAAQLITMAHYSRFPNPSKLWKYCGLAPVDGRIPKKRRGQKGVKFKLKAVVCYKIGWMGFIYKNSVYRLLYDQFYQSYKTRVYEDNPLNRLGDVLAEPYGRYKAGTVLDQRKAMWLIDHGVTRVKVVPKPAHAMKMALIKMVKIFLCHYWLVGRWLDGLDITTPWIIQYGGHGDIYPPMVDKPEPMVWPNFWEIKDALEEELGRKLSIVVPKGVRVKEE